MNRFQETLLDLPTLIAERSAADDCWEVQSERLKVWTDPDPDSERVYINVYEETESGLRRVKAITGMIFVPVVTGDVISLHTENGNLFLEMKDFYFERLTYQSIEFCPMWLWDMEATTVIRVPGIIDRLEIEPVTLEQRVAFEIAHELSEDFGSEPEE